MKTLGTFLLVLAAGTPGWADVVALRSGGQLRGTIVAETTNAVTIDVGPGQIGIERSEILGIRRGASPLATYQQRAAALAPGDVAGWLALARWARDQGLATQSREAFERCVSLDPANAEARTAMGYVLQNGSWMTQTEAMRARGLVQYEGEWLTPEEHRARLEEARLDLERERIEAETRVRIQEAEVRAREAEARAAEAAAEAEAATANGPTWWVGPSAGWSSRGRGHHGRTGHRGKGQGRETTFGKGPWNARGTEGAYGGGDSHAAVPPRAHSGERAHGSRASHGGDVRRRER